MDLEIAEYPQLNSYSTHKLNLTGDTKFID